MGAVYEVEHLHTGQRLALKVLTSQPGASVERFRREARAASLIRSDHIVRVTDADVAPELNGAPFLVMELLQGADLERATGNRPAAPGVVVDWLRQVARALGKAHQAGLVHRDLKPENLFLTEREDGTPLVKILDFGIAKMSAEGAGLTGSDAFLGTPGYMAPEQTDSKGPPITPRADLYSLGLVAFKLLTGRVYWVTGSLAQLLAQILAQPMPPASERGAMLGPRFDAWFAKACDRNPQNRFASAEEQVEALAEALSLPTRPLPDSAARSSAPPVPGPDKHGIELAQWVDERSSPDPQEGHAASPRRWAGRGGGHGGCRGRRPARQTDDFPDIDGRDGARLLAPAAAGSRVRPWPGNGCGDGRRRESGRRPPCGDLRRDHSTFESPFDPERRSLPATDPWG